MGLGLGIDTGGTYTDAVIFDFTQERVLYKAKSLTTRNDLSIGISDAISQMKCDRLSDVELVSVSSTLATNSIVEGKGCRVALLVAGRDYDRSIPVDSVARISGGHTLSGNEAEPLDEDAARRFIEENAHKVDAFAISSFLSVRNPEHENRMKKIVEETCSKPVVCGHHLSSSLGFNERTLTTVMNARLIPIISELIVSVKEVLSRLEIRAPMMIVKGDGSMMSEAVALQRPVETILSGPASSLTGAKMLTGENDAIVIDIGGTTTDIGILRNGQPRLDLEGAMIGGRRTHVMAADISTSGIGGDSRFVVNGHKLMLTSLRVIPLCIGATHYPSIVDRLRAASDRAFRFTPESFEVNNIIQDVEFFVFLKDCRGADISDNDRAFIELLKKGPYSIREASEILGIHQFGFNAKRLEEMGLVTRMGLTPTDILHAEGTYTEFCSDASHIAVAQQAARMHISPKEFIKRAKTMVVDKLSMELLKKLVYEETGKEPDDAISIDILRKAITGRPGKDYMCKITLTNPIIGIGAPVASYLPLIAERFQAQLILPEHAEVGNAIGAITGSIVEKMDILIKPKQGMGTIEDPPCIMFSPLEKKEFDTITEASIYAVEIGSTHVERMARLAGADSINIKVENHDRKFGFGQEYDGEALLEKHIRVTAVGKPKQFFSRGMNK